MSEFKIALIGDVMLGDHPVCFGHGVRSAIRRQGLATLLREVRPYLQRHDALLGNLECVLSRAKDDRDLPSSELRGDPDSAPDLSLCEFNLFNIANNHILQHGEAAFSETCRLLEQNNARAVGMREAGGSNVVTVEKQGVKLAVLGCSFRPEHFCKTNTYYAQPTAQALVEQVRATKARLPDHHIVVSLHWGEEYLHEPSASQIELAHQLIDSGASLIAGHHPHVLQGVESYKNGLIAYSLGNFLFDSWQLPTRESAILSCTFSPVGIVGHEWIPVFIERDFSVSVEQGRRRGVSKKLAEYTNAIAQRKGLTTADDATYARIAEKAYLKYRLECYVYFLSRLWKYHPRVIYYSLFRSVLRRLGLV